VIDSTRINETADRLFDALERNDAAAVEACCAPGAVFWANGRRQGTVEDMAVALSSLQERIGWHRYLDVRRSVFEGGFVEEHLVESHPPGSGPERRMACVVASLDEEGRVTELREYVPASRRRAIADGADAPDHR
jgi:ketosteroid isomerase-like protein